MRLIHLADLHLGFRRFDRLTPAGENLREHDVATTLERVVDQIITIAPDLVVVAGDVFHASKPSNGAIRHAFAQVARLRRRLPDAIVVIISGNHDVPRGAEACVLPLFQEIDGVIVVDRAPQRLAFADRQLSVLAVPEAPRLQLPRFEPDPTARFNVLLFHGEIAGVIPHGDQRTANVVQPAELEADRWDYIALGHHHVCHQVAPTAWYAGSIDYTSSNVWGELANERAAALAGKSIIERDMVTGVHVIHPLPASRPHLDLEPVSAFGLTAAEIDARIRERIESTSIDDAIARLRILDIDTLVARALDQKALRGYRKRAAALQIDYRRTPVQKAPTMDEVARAMKGRLEDVVRRHLEDRDLPADVDREELQRMAAHYLELAADDAPTALPTAVEEPAHAA